MTNALCPAIYNLKNDRLEMFNLIEDQVYDTATAVLKKILIKITEIVFGY
jgi:hypothetical protein